MPSVERAETLARLALERSEALRQVGLDLKAYAHERAVEERAKLPARQRAMRHAARVGAARKAADGDGGP